MSLHRSSAWPLTWVAVALIVYATLHPWSGWHWPDGQVFRWTLPRLGFEVANDLVANILGYLPFGLILCVAHLRSGRGPMVAALVTVLTGAMLSYTLELIQYTIPTRVPSITDWILNTLGTAWGALAALTIHALGLVDMWHRLRERWFIPQAGHGLALLWMWPLGLLFPPPLPLGEGQLLPRVRVLLMEATRDTPLQAWILPADPLTMWSSFHVSVATSSWAPVIESLTTTAGLLAPMCVACAVARPRSLRVILLTMLVSLAIGATALSTALNFGPVHAFTWLTMPAVVGMLLGAFGGVFLVDRSRTTCAVLGVLVVLFLIGLIHLAPLDPYYAQTLQAWENGRFIRFHGLSRWFGILWPYVALAWLIGRLWGRETLASAQQR
ncbi:MAG TPA: VanZ family protein [Aquabacterium sp.]|uniref:VanZ family protein n=1 Tax=Aquabacterium sp. TaxID=1872578 RepID=UPI002E2EAE68|nr:VanZ family protein [Aquabacterium sp.]HEX5355634.1 VanZ family protein [Aquabacterium sp.]